ncbi:hypothetical protein [Streptomyces odontomachi]|uniref:hypothetical protein n=1 Tax=Streptomyces odontomachi TaxID=2944940 RepID=UPI0021097807|nr:hypothetical protein [Streptomyces sp. ODS25]
MTDFDAGWPKPRPPAKLGPAGRRSWREVVDRYELRPDESRILGDACREADIVERIEAELTDAPLTVKRSMGTARRFPVGLRGTAAPLGPRRTAEVAQAPDTPADVQRKRTAVSAQARAAVRARWGRVKGV